MKKLILLSFIFCSQVFAFQAKSIFKGKGVLWGFSFINEKELFLTFREGKFFHLSLENNQLTSLSTPKVWSRGQGGLLDVYYYKKNVYLTFSHKEKDKVSTALAKGQWENGKLKGLKIIFKSIIEGDTSRHFGSRLVADGEFLFMTIGDRGERKYAQNLKVHNGKILRLTLDGKPAKGNPFSKMKGALPEVWSYGHRNPQGIDLNKDSRQLYSVEFGPRGGDELNLIEKGKNYGWPIITYGKEYWGPSIGATHKEGMEQPVEYWVPSISPSGMLLYSGKKYKELKGHIFLANLSSKHLRMLKVLNKKVTFQKELFKSLKERVRQVRESPSGEIFFSSDSGHLYKLYK